MVFFREYKSRNNQDDITWRKITPDVDGKIVQMLYSGEISNIVLRTHTGKVYDVQRVDELEITLLDFPTPIIDLGVISTFPEEDDFYGVVIIVLDIDHNIYVCIQYPNGNETIHKLGLPLCSALSASHLTKIISRPPTKNARNY